MPIDDKKRFHGNIFSYPDTLYRLYDFVPMEYGFSRRIGRHTLEYANYPSRFMLIIIKSGKGIIEIVNKPSPDRYGFGPGTCYIIFPTERVIITPDPDDPPFYTFLSFTGKYAYLFSQKERTLVYDESAFNDILSVCADESPLMIFRLSSVIQKMCSLSPAPLESFDMDVLHVNAACLYIDNHFSKQMSCKSVAKFMKLSEKYLSRCFKSVTGMTCQEYLMRKKMSVALALIRHKRTIAFTAEAVGYEDYSAFSKAFKKYYGCTPGEAKRLPEDKLIN